MLLAIACVHSRVLGCFDAVCCSFCQPTSKLWCRDFFSIWSILIILHTLVESVYTGWLKTSEATEFECPVSVSLKCLNQVEAKLSRFSAVCSSTAISATLRPFSQDNLGEPVSGTITHLNLNYLHCSPENFLFVSSIYCHPNHLPFYLHISRICLSELEPSVLNTAVNSVFLTFTT